VAGLDATSLKADAPAELSGWLGKHGYPSSTALQRWLDPYVNKHWIITAFKVPHDDPTSPDVGTSALRMTFPLRGSADQAPRPFFPYREPEDQRRDDPPRTMRLLRVYFLGEARVQATLGDKGAWPGQVVWAGPVAADKRKSLLEALKLTAQTAPATWWLTEFEDRSAPRPGTDEVYFSPAADQSPRERNPVTQIVYEDEGGGPAVKLDPTDWILLWVLLVLFLTIIVTVTAWLLLTRKNRFGQV
jgi:hypothetical protein